MAYIAKPEIMTALYHIGDGVNVIQNAGHFANIFFLVVLGLNVAALIPVYFANPPCRRRFFGQEGEGACSCFKTCAQKVIGNVITAWMEILMFVSLLCCLGISCAFLFGVALITMLQNICQAGESAIGITVDIIKQIATQDGNVGQIDTVGFLSARDTSNVSRHAQSDAALPLGAPPGHLVGWCSGAGGR